MTMESGKRMEFWRYQSIHVMGLHRDDGNMTNRGVFHGHRGYHNIDGLGQSIFFDDLELTYFRTPPRVLSKDVKY